VYGSDIRLVAYAIEPPFVHVCLEGNFFFFKMFWYVVINVEVILSSLSYLLIFLG
jgi:hypothetical protein